MKDVMEPDFSCPFLENCGKVILIFYYHTVIGIRFEQMRRSEQRECKIMGHVFKWVKTAVLPDIGEAFRRTFSGSTTIFPISRLLW